MKFTAQEEYGLRCLLNLARAFGQQDAGIRPGLGAGFMTVGAIGEKEGLSTQYAGKLFRILAKAELVESIRGCKGGYRLTRPPNEITVGEVLTSLGGKFYEPKICERYVGDRSFCVHTSECSIRSLWGGLQLILDAVLSSTTLEDLVGSERPMIQWVQDSVIAVRKTLEELEKAAGVSGPAGGELSSASGFSGREIPVLQDHTEGR